MKGTRKMFINIKEFGAVADGVTDNTQVIQNAQNNLLFMESLPEYRNDLLNKLEGAKRQAKRRVLSPDHKHCIDASKDMYDQATTWDANDFGHVVGNSGYFQNGIIHEIVDDKEFEWSLEVEDEH